LVPLVTTIALLMVVASVVLFFFAFVRIWLSLRQNKDRSLLRVAGTEPYLSNTKLLGLAFAGVLCGTLLMGILQWTGLAAA
jgi:hypothetical protein